MQIVILLCYLCGVKWNCSKLDIPNHKNRTLKTIISLQLHGLNFHKNWHKDVIGISLN